MSKRSQKLHDYFLRDIAANFREKIVLKIFCLLSRLDRGIRCQRIGWRKFTASRPRKYTAVGWSARALRSPDITRGISLSTRASARVCTRAVHRHRASSRHGCRNALLLTISQRCLGIARKSEFVANLVVLGEKTNGKFDGNPCEDGSRWARILRIPRRRMKLYRETGEKF